MKILVETASVAAFRGISTDGPPLQPSQTFQGRLVLIGCSFDLQGPSEEAETAGVSRSSRNQNPSRISLIHQEYLHTREKEVEEE